MSKWYLACNAIPVCDRISHNRAEIFFIKFNDGSGVHRGQIIFVTSTDNQLGHKWVKRDLLLDDAPEESCTEPWVLSKRVYAQTKNQFLEIIVVSKKIFNEDRFEALPLYRA